MERVFQKSKVTKNRFFKNNASVLGVYAFLIVFILLVGCLDEDFLSVRNFQNLLVTACAPMMIAFAQGTVMLTGGIDLSLGGVVAFTNVVCVTLMKPENGAGWVLAVLSAVLTGALCGAFNGLLITKGRLAPIIVTLASNWIFAGAALFVMPAAGGSVHAGFAKVLNSRLGGIPAALWIILIALMLIRTITNRTPFGKALRAIGGNEHSAFSTGINVERTKLKAYLLSGVFASVAGIFLAAQMYSGNPKLGESYAMNAVTAVVLGGCSMSGAVGDMLGVTAGVFIVSIINNMLNLMGISSFYQYVVQGVILIVALSISPVKNMLAELMPKKETLQ